MANDEKRARLIKAIQACRRQVAGLDDDTAWRDWLDKVAGGRSLSAMTGPQLGRVLDGLHAAGAPKRAPSRPAGSRYADTQQMRMIRGLWAELAGMEAIRDPSEQALGAFILRQTRQQMGYLSPANAAKVVEALKAMRRRHAGRDGAGNG